MMNNKLFSKLVYLAAIGLSIFLLFFVIAGTWIGYEVKRVGREAVWQYEGDSIQALTKQLADKHQGYRRRNDAIWALGQMGDKRALPVLQNYYTGKIPRREPLNKSLSQYELKKAIETIKSGVNITAFLWR